MKKLLTAASVAALAFGVANAVDVQNVTGGVAAGDLYPLASQANGVTGNVDFELAPTAGSFPSGNVIVFIDVAGATFSS
ncbi:MAG: hypothetical protein V2I43_26165, partial [Parvularcula sp.]|nr:hypothetical protein [Parvularcula sp.]